MHKWGALKVYMIFDNIEGLYMMLLLDLHAWIHEELFCWQKNYRDSYYKWDNTTFKTDTGAVITLLADNDTDTRNFDEMKIYICFTPWYLRLNIYLTIPISHMET